jgi:hypothetical protein
MPPEAGEAWGNTAKKAHGRSRHRDPQPHKGVRGMHRSAGRQPAGPARRDHARPAAPGSTTQRQALAPGGEIEDALCAGIVGCL